MKTYAEAREIFRRQAKEAKARYEAADAREKAIMEGTKGNFKAWKEAREKYAAELEKIELELCEAATDENRNTYAAQVASDMEEAEAANKVLEALKAAPKKIQTTPTHYKKFESFLKEIAPEGFSAYVKTSLTYTTEIIVYKAGSYSSDETATISISGERVNGSLTPEGIANTKPLELIPVNEIFAEVLKAEEAHAAIMKIEEEAKKAITAARDGIRADRLKNRIPYYMTLEGGTRYFY